MTRKLHRDAGTGEPRAFDLSGRAMVCGYVDSDPLDGSRESGRARSCDQ